MREVPVTHYVYMVECTDQYDSLYVGYTTDIGRRVAEHNAGDGAAYTRSRRPVSLRYVEFWDSKSAAMSREWALKQLSRAEKEALVPDAETEVAISVDTPGDE